MIGVAAGVTKPLWGAATLPETPVEPDKFVAYTPVMISTWEHGMEAVALDLDLGSVIARDGGTDDAQVVLEQLDPGRVAGTLDERGVAAQIREQETAVG